MKNGFPYFRAQGFSLKPLFVQASVQNPKIFNLISSKIKKLLYRYTETAAFILKSAESQIFIYLITRNGICLETTAAFIVHSSSETNHTNSTEKLNLEYIWGFT